MHAALLDGSDVTVRGDADGNDMTWLLDGVQVAHGRFTRATACVEFASGERVHGADARWLATLGDIDEMSDSEPEPALES